VGGGGLERGEGSENDEKRYGTNTKNDKLKNLTKAISCAYIIPINFSETSGRKAGGGVERGSLSR
jgi:hypothetical protein